MPAAKDRPTKVRVAETDLGGLSNLVRKLKSPGQHRVELSKRLSGLEKDELLVFVVRGTQAGLERLGGAPEVSEIMEKLQVELLNEIILQVSANLSGLTTASGAPLTEPEKNVLREGGFEPDAKADFEPIKATWRAYYRILESSLTVEQAAKRLGTDPSRIRQRLSAKPRTLYGVKVAGEWRLPAFQFDEAGLVPGLDKVVAVLDPELSPVEVESWLKSPHVDLVDENKDELQLSPLDWLRMGRAPEPVAELASNL